MLHPVLDHGPQRRQTGSQGEMTVQGVGRPTQDRDRAHARTRACSRPLHSPQGRPGTPRSSWLHPGCHHASKEAHAWSCGTPGTQRGSCVPAWNVPEGSSASQSSASHSGHKNVEGIASRVAFHRGLVLQKTRERFQVLSGGSPVLSALSSCPRACACSYSAVENPTFRFWTFEDGGEMTEVSRACHPRQGPSRVVTQGEPCDHY